MKPSFVLDASITLSWAFPEEANQVSTALLERLEHDVAIVPSLWYLEIVNGLATAEKRKRITTARSEEFLTLVSAFQLVVDEEAPKRAFTSLIPLCRAHKLTSYDAVYLELAIRRQLPLATLDGHLKREAGLLGITHYG